MKIGIILFVIFMLSEVVFCMGHPYNQFWDNYLFEEDSQRSEDSYNQERLEKEQKIAVIKRLYDLSIIKQGTIKQGVFTQEQMIGVLCSSCFSSSFLFKTITQFPCNHVLCDNCISWYSNRQPVTCTICKRNFLEQQQKKEQRVLEKE